MASSEVFLNRDLSRKIVQAKHGVRLLSTSKKIRNNEECTPQFERWRSAGCPIDPSEGEMACMQAAGKICDLEFNMQSMGENPRDGVPAAKAASYVMRKMKEGCVLNFVMGETSVRIHVGEENGITVTRDGWQKRGIACGPTRDQIQDLVHALMTKTGTVKLPCMESSSAGSRVEVPRRMSLRLECVALLEGEGEKTRQGGRVLTAIRT